MFEDTNMKAVSAEVMGTFFLVFIGLTAFGALAGVDEAGNVTGLFGAAFAFGTTLMVLMHIMGPISGCHLNPAVSIGNFMSNKMSQDDAIAYVLAQIGGAFIAAAAIGGTFNFLSGDMAILGQAVVGTAFFVMVYLSTTDPWAIGGTLFVMTAMASSFGEVNPGILAGGAIEANLLADTAPTAEAASATMYAMVGGVIGAIAGWAVKDNVLD